MHKYWESQPHRVKNKLEIILTDPLGTNNQGRPTQISRSNFQRRTGLSPYQVNGDQMLKEKEHSASKERSQNLSELFQHENPDKYENASPSKEIDFSKTYLRKSDVPSNKRRARYYYLNQRKSVLNHQNNIVGQGPKETHKIESTSNFQ